MNWRWLIYDYIPPELNLSRSEWLAVRKQVQAGAREVRAKSGCLLNLLGLVCVASLIFGHHFLLKSVLPPRYPVSLIFLITFPLIIYIVVALIWRYRYENFTFRILREKGHAICLHCGYLLKGRPENETRCPECGLE